VKAKPSLAILAGVAVGPAMAIFGTPSGNLGGAIRKMQDGGGVSGAANEFVNVLGIAYLGHNFQQNMSASWSEGGYWGTAGLIGGMVAHKLAGWSGLNRYLARMKMPFRI
jgi:hypothetical protein